MDKTKPEVKIMLDKERVLCLDLNGMSEIEKITGKSIFDGTFFQGVIWATDIKLLLWGCLQHEDPDITLQRAGWLVSTDNIVEVTAKLNVAVRAAIPMGMRKSDGPLPVEQVAVEQVPVKEGSTG